MLTSGITCLTIMRKPFNYCWQAAGAVLAGIVTGCLLLLVLGRTSEQAFSHALTSGSALFGVPGEAVTALPAPPGWPTLNERMNLLVMGVDSNGKGTQRFIGTRSDAMMLVSLNPATKQVGLVSIPRDSRVEIDGHGSDKINAAHAFGGPELAVSTVRNTFSVPVDHYMVIDTQGLKVLFQSLGPVKVLVEKPMHYHDLTAGLYIDLEPGMQMLDPAQAEAYLRFRHDATGDLGRMDRQQWFLRQVEAKLREPQIILKLPELIAFARDNVVTDMTAPDMVKVVAFLKDISPCQIETARLPGQPATIAGLSYWLPDMEQSRLVLARLVAAGSPSRGWQTGSSDRMPPYMVPSAEPGRKAKPISFALKYPRGAEDAADRMELALNSCGYCVRYKWPSAPADCQHEQITQMSQRADEGETAALRKHLPDLTGWPVVLAPEAHPAADFTLVMSPESAKSSLR